MPPSRFGWCMVTRQIGLLSPDYKISAILERTGVKAEYSIEDLFINIVENRGWYQNEKYDQTVNVENYVDANRRIISVYRTPW